MPGSFFSDCRIGHLKSEVMSCCKKDREARFCGGKKRKEVKRKGKEKKREEKNRKEIVISTRDHKTGHLFTPRGLKIASKNIMEYT